MRSWQKIACAACALWAIACAPGRLAAQSVSRPAFGANATAERIPNLDALKNTLRQYHDCTCACGCYPRDLEEQAGQAIAFLRQRAAHRRPGEKLAMVLDIDETTLSNYREMKSADFAYAPAVFNAWAESAQAPAIPGTLRLFNEARKLGVDTIFITGRPASLRATTERNLRRQGFHGWEELILRGKDQAAMTAGEYKRAARSHLIAEGYTLVLNVGDQWSDLKGSPEAEFSVKYPNPFYSIP